MKQSTEAVPIKETTKMHGSTTIKQVRQTSKGKSFQIALVLSNKV